MPTYDVLFLRHVIDRKLEELRGLAFLLGYPEAPMARPWPEGTPIAVKLAIAGLHQDIADVIEHHERKLIAAQKIVYHM